MSQRRYIYAQVFIVLLLAVAFAMPHIIFQREHPQSGLLKITTTDDGHYQARVKAVLLGRYAEARNGVTGGGPPAPGGPPALVETVVGTAFAWTELKAPQVMLILTVLLTPLIAFVLARLLFIVTSSRIISLLGSVLYVIVFSSALQKPVNMSIALPISVLALLALAEAWRNPTLLRSLVCGVLCGLLPWVYFWSWTYLWSVGALLLVLHLLFSPRSEEKRRRTKMLVVTAVIGLIISLSYAIELLTFAQSMPFFLETAYRSTIIHSRGVESVPRTVLLLLLLLGTVALAYRSERSSDRSWIFPLAVVAGIVTAMYQNAVHGIIMSFSSHFYPFVCLSALVAGAWAASRVRQSLLAWLVILLSAVFLIAGLWDYRSVWSVLAGQYYVRGIDHLRPALMALDNGVRETVLTDRVSAHMVTTWTDDDVVFTAYTKHLIISNREYAERYCLSEIFNPAGPDFPWLASEVVEQKERVDELQKWEQQFHQICAPVMAHPEEFLKKYDVSWVLWNERIAPTWKLDLSYVMKQRAGVGWSLWRIRL